MSSLSFPGAIRRLPFKTEYPLLAISAPTKNRARLTALSYMDWLPRATPPVAPSPFFEAQNPMTCWDHDGLGGKRASWRHSSCDRGHSTLARAVLSIVGSGWSAAVSSRWKYPIAPGSVLVEN